MRTSELESTTSVPIRAHIYSTALGMSYRRRILRQRRSTVAAQLQSQSQYSRTVTPGYARGGFWSGSRCRRSQGT
eukprot:8271416-Pyramimonas_sp.AAC.1